VGPRSPAARWGFETISTDFNRKGQSGKGIIFLLENHSGGY
jgi:hypothetical protein